MKLTLSVKGRGGREGEGGERERREGRKMLKEEVWDIGM